MANSTVKWFGDTVKKKMRERQTVAINKACVYLVGQVIKSMKKGTGEAYTVGGKTIQRSAPGQPPAVDMGRLRASITFQVSDSISMHMYNKVRAKAKAGDGVGKPMATGLTEVIGVVGTNVEYGRYLELGTPKIKPRPFLRTALENNRTQILKYFDFGGK